MSAREHIYFDSSNTRAREDIDWRERREWQYGEFFGCRVYMRYGESHVYTKQIEYLYFVANVIRMEK